MVVLVVTILAWMIVAGQIDVPGQIFVHDPPTLTRAIHSVWLAPQFWGSLAVAGLISVLVEIGILRAILMRKAPPSDRSRPFVRSLGWIGLNAGIAVLCGVGLVFLLRSPLLDWMSALAVMIAAGLIELSAEERRQMPCPDASAVVVEEFPKPLPRDPDKLNQFVFDTFANQPAEDQFSNCRERGWKERYHEFAAALVERAQGSGLDAASLAHCLRTVFPSKDGLAYLPVGAYQAEQRRKRVWSLVIKWEGTSDGLENSEPQDSPPVDSMAGPSPPTSLGLGLGHVRVFVFEAESGRQIGFATCG